MSIQAILISKAVLLKLAHDRQYGGSFFGKRFYFVYAPTIDDALTGFRVTQNFTQPGRRANVHMDY